MSIVIFPGQEHALAARYYELPSGRESMSFTKALHSQTLRLAEWFCWLEYPLKGRQKGAFRRGEIQRLRRLRSELKQNI